MHIIHGGEPPSKGPGEGIDLREQPFNAREIGPAPSVQVSRERIAILHGILLDLDPHLLLEGVLTLGASEGPKLFYDQTVRHWLARDPVLARAEVRSSGRGLHTIVWFEEPLVFNTDRERDRWTGIVQVVQAALPIDPDQPGITALTRPIGSINGKNGQRVERLEPGEPVPIADVLALFERMGASPFRTVMAILLGTDRAYPCPVCGAEGTSLGAGDHLGFCYGSCGKVNLAQLYDVFLAPRGSTSEEGEDGRKKGSRGQALAQRLAGGTAQANRSPLPGARNLPVLHGVSPGGICADSQENVMATARRFLVDSGRIFRHGESVVYEVGEGEEGKLVPLADGPHVVAAAPSLLANIFVCEKFNPNTKTVSQYAPPAPFVSVVLNAEPTTETLPEIRTYAKRPVFDEHFTLLGPGWHPEPGILVHGPAIEPVITPAGDPGLGIRDRLPPHLRVLFDDFCFRSDADVANAVGALLTGLLTAHFVTAGKALILLDGNQPGIGKTLLARIFGIILDGIDPQLIHYTSDDEELAKRVCATLRGSGQSILLLDNAKTKAGGAISSPVIEANSMAAQVSLRILGESANYTRPNDILWCLTMNETRTSPDLVSRGLPIRFKFEGDPAKRTFGGRDPLDYARQHRVAILGELAGMVIRWNQLGRPIGKRPHRLTRWAEVIGGILEVAGLPDFLENLDEAAASFNASLDELTALAEEVVKKKVARAFVVQDTREDPAALDIAGDLPGLRPGEWVATFRVARVLVEKLDDAKSERSRTTTIGNFFAQNRDREVPIEVGDCSGRARLSGREVGKKQTGYFFRIAWDGPGPVAAGAPSNPGGSLRLVDVPSPPQPGASLTAPGPPTTPSGARAADRDAGDDPDRRDPAMFANEEIW